MQQNTRETVVFFYFHHPDRFAPVGVSFYPLRPPPELLAACWVFGMFTPCFCCCFSTSGIWDIKQ